MPFLQYTNSTMITVDFELRNTLNISYSIDERKTKSKQIMTIFTSFFFGY